MIDSINNTILTIPEYLLVVIVGSLLFVSFLGLISFFSEFSQSLYRINSKEGKFVSQNCSDGKKTRKETKK